MEGDGYEDDEVEDGVEESVEDGDGQEVSASSLTESEALGLDEETCSEDSLAFIVLRESQLQDAQDVFPSNQ